MLRDENQRELDWKFTRFETWEEFLTRWRAVDTEEEAIGLLYAGTKLPYRESYKSAAEVEERVNFYIRWANHENEVIHTTAQQLLIKHWLRKVQMTTEYVKVHQALLKFLVEIGEALALAIQKSYFPVSFNEQRFTLLKPPHPRFVAEYLVKMYEVWHHPYKQECDYTAFQILTETFAAAACSWGVSYMFARDGNGKPTIHAIEQFLEQRGYDPGKVFLTLSGYGEPLANLSFPGAQQQVSERAALALLKMRYWFGGGVREMFASSVLHRSNK